MNRIANSLSLIIGSILILLAALAFATMKWPFIIFIGLFFLIIPGIFLMMTPTLFLWVGIFSVPWFATRLFLRGYRNEGLATLPAVGIPAGLGIAALIIVSWIIVAPSRSAAEARLAEFHLSNVVPASKIKLHGDVKLETERASWATDRKMQVNGVEVFACDSNCIWLLSDGGAASVTVNEIGWPVSFTRLKNGRFALSGGAMTYRLMPKGKCDPGSPEMQLDVAPYTLTDPRAAARWRRRVLAGHCLQAGPAAKDQEFVLRAGHWLKRSGFSSYPDSTVWERVPEGMEATFSEIRDKRGRVLMRDYRPSAEALAIPLGLGAEEIGDEYGWARTYLPESKERDPTLKFQRLFKAIAPQPTA